MQAPRDPLISRGLASGSNWGLESFVHDLFDERAFGNQKTEFRICPSNSGKTVRECDSLIINGTFAEMKRWSTGAEDIGEFSSLPVFANNEIFAYADYKHFVELFANQEKFPTFGSWKEIGLTDVDSSQCTLWVGTRHAHTVRKAILECITQECNQSSSFIPTCIFSYIHECSPFTTILIVITLLYKSLEKRGGNCGSLVQKINLLDYLKR